MKEQKLTCVQAIASWKRAVWLPSQKGQQAAFRKRLRTRMCKMFLDTRLEVDDHKNSGFPFDVPFKRIRKGHSQNAEPPILSLRAGALHIFLERSPICDGSAVCGPCTAKRLGSLGPRFRDKRFRDKHAKRFRLESSARPRSKAAETLLLSRPQKGEGAEAHLRPSYRILEASLPECGGQKPNVAAPSSGARVSAGVAHSRLSTGMLCKEKRRMGGTKLESR